MDRRFTIMGLGNGVQNVYDGLFDDIAFFYNGLKSIIVFLLKNLKSLRIMRNGGILRVLGLRRNE